MQVSYSILREQRINFSCSSVLFCGIKRVNNFPGRRTRIKEQVIKVPSNWRDGEDDCNGGSVVVSTHYSCGGQIDKSFVFVSLPLLFPSITSSFVFLPLFSGCCHFCFRSLRLLTLFFFFLAEVDLHLLSFLSASSFHLLSSFNSSLVTQNNLFLSLLSSRI